MRGPHSGCGKVLQTLVSCGPEFLRLQQPIGGRLDLSGQQLLLETDELSGVWLDEVWTPQ